MKNIAILSITAIEINNFFNPFKYGSFLYTSKTFKNVRFFDVFKGIEIEYWLKWVNL